MSYVKGVVIYNNRAAVREVHGSVWKLNCRKELAYRNGNLYYVTMPNSVRTEQDYINFARANEIIVSGITQDRFRMGCPSLDTPLEKQRYKYFLDKENSTNTADDPPKGFKYNLVVDLDKNYLMDSNGEWYAEYTKYLPQRWHSSIAQSGAEMDAYIKQRQSKSGEIKVKKHKRRV